VCVCVCVRECERERETYDWSVMSSKSKSTSSVFSASAFGSKGSDDRSTTDRAHPRFRRLIIPRQVYRDEVDDTGEDAPNGENGEEEYIEEEEEE
jgi:hypothetical protein